MDQVKLKHDALLKLNLPVNIQLGIIKHLEVRLRLVNLVQIRIPWLTLGSSPVEVIIEGLNLILSPQQKSQWEMVDIFDQTFLENKLMAAIQDIKSKLVETDNQGYFEKLATKVIDNLQISIKDFHIRYEDHFTGDQQYSFGIVVNLLEARTTNADWVQKYIDRTQQGSNPNLFKMLQIQGFGVYLNPQDNIIIHQQTLAQDKRIQMMDAIMQNQDGLLQYILKPMNLKIKFELQTKEIKKLNLSINLDNINIAILKTQLKCLIKSLDLVSEYRRFQNYLIKTKKFKFLRPIAPSVNKRNAREWWKFAFKCIQKSTRAKNGSIREFIIPKSQIQTYEQQYKILFLRFYKQGSSAQLSNEERTMFRHILLSVEFTCIREWSKALLEPLIAKEKSQPQESNFTDWLLGRTRSQSQTQQQEILDQDEIQELKKELESSVVLKEVQKKAVHVNVDFVIKDISIEFGYFNEENKVKGFIIFASDFSISFKSKQKQDLELVMEGSIADFGIDLFQKVSQTSELVIEDHIIISNKKIFPQSLEEQWRLKIRKKPEDLRNVEHDIQLISVSFICHQLLQNPLVFMYNHEFVKRAIIITKLGLDESYQTSAIDTFEDIREATSHQVYNIIYKKANRFRINIASPVVILPISGSNDQNSPVWVLRLGDFQAVTQNQERSTAIMEYENYEILVDSIRMQYYSSFNVWYKNLENLKNFREKTIVKESNDLVFSVVEDCWLKFNVGVKQKSAGLLMLTKDQKEEHSMKPKIIIKGYSSDVKINLTHSIYNKLVNMSMIFDMSKDKELNNPIQEDQILSKKQVMKNAKKIGQIQKRLDPSIVWETYFCILSDNYLYFYKDSHQLMPSSYFYMKKCEIMENQEDLGLPNNAILRNRFGDCCLAFPNAGHQRDWISKLKARIFEIDMEEREYRDNIDLGTSEPKQSNSTIKKAQKQINHRAVQMEVSFEMKSFKTILIDELQNFSEWLMLNFKKLRIRKTQRKTSGSLDIVISELTLIDLMMKVNSTLICQQKYQGENVDYQQNALEVTIVSNSKQNPSYQGVDQAIEINMDNLNIKFQPISINELLKFLQNTRPNKSFNLMEKEEFINSQLSETLQTDEDVDDLENIKSVIETKKDDIQVKPSCKTIKEIIRSITVNMKKLSMSLLHQDFHMDLYRLDTQHLLIKYITKYDHMNFETNFKDVIIYDLTGYPYTHCPKTFAENPALLQQKQRQFISCQSKDTKSNQFALAFAFETYYSNTCDLKKEGFSSKISLQIMPLDIEYFQEAFMRFISYFFEQFLNSLTQSNPYKDPKVDLELIKTKRTIKRDTMKKLVNLKQVSDIIDMNITINDLSLKVPDRPESQNFIGFNINQLHVIQSISLKGKRIHSKQDQKLYVKSFKIACDDVAIKFGPVTQLTKEAFSVKLNYENLAYSPLLQRIDPSLIEQASHITINFNPVELVLPQNIYTGILRCMDLNINFTDFKQKEYFFVRFVDIEEYYKQLINIVSMRIKIKFKALSIKLQHLDGSFLSELLLFNFGLNMTKFMDSTNKMIIKIENFYISESDTDDYHAYKGLLTSEQIQQQAQLHNLTYNQYVIQPLNENKNNGYFKVSNQYQSSLPKKESQVIVNMTTNPDGEKDINIGIAGLKITVKPHILLMVYYYFLNSFPVYDESSIDKPSYINFDPEDSSKMNFSVEIDDSLICLQNKPGLKTVCCSGKIIFQFKRDNVKKRKQMLLNAQNAEDLLFEQNLNDIADKYVWSMNIVLQDLCPFVCSISQLNTKDDFTKVKKRQLLTPFSLRYQTSYELGYQKAGRTGDLIFGVDSLSEVTLDKVKMKVSLQDMHLLFQIITFANDNVSKEYLKRLELIQQYAKNAKDADKPDILEIKEYVNNRTKTIKEDFGIEINNVDEVNKRHTSNLDGSEDQDKFEGIIDNIHQNYERTISRQMQRLRTTTKAFSKMANKYTTTSQASQKRELSKVKGDQTDDFKTVYSRSDFKEVDEPLTHKAKIDSIQPFFKENQTVQRKGDNPSQYLDGSSSYQKTPDQRYLRVQEDRYSAMRRSRQITEGDDEDFKDARSELFYSAHDDRTHSQMATPLNADQGREINAQIQQDLINMEKQQNQVQYQNALQNLFKSVFTFDSKGLSILFINDYDNVFCPVLDIDIPDVYMKSEQVSESSSVEININLKALYFNAFLGDWEPFIESFEATYLQNKVGQQQFMQIDFPSPIYINITENCLTSLISTYNSWIETPPYQYDDQQMRMRLLSSQISNSQVQNENSNSNSINKEQEEEDISLKIEDTKQDKNWKDADKIKVDDNVEKVTPYSIRNLTHYKISVTRLHQNDHQQDENPMRRTLNLMQRTSQGIYEIDPEDECEYAIDYEKEATQIMNNTTKRRNGISQRIEANHQTSKTGQSRNRNKNQHHVTIHIDKFNPIKDVDLNKIQSCKHNLEPIVEQYFNANNEEDDEERLIPNRITEKSRKTQGGRTRYNNANEVLLYGVSLDKLRKILTIRTPYIIYNHTRMEYIIRIRQSQSDVIKDEYALKPEQKHSLGSEFYEGHTIEVQLRKRRGTLKIDEMNRQKTLQLKEVIQIEQIIDLDIDDGILIENDESRFTYIQKSLGEIKNSYDIIILPPVSIRNALPTTMQIMLSHKIQGVIVDDLETYNFEKGEEKQFYIMGYQGTKKDEVQLNFKLDLFEWTMLTFKNKPKSRSDDREIKVRDLDGNELQLMVRISSKHAGFNLTFYASTIIMNHSHQKLMFYYDTINRSLVAGQDPRLDFCIANKEDKLLASINDRYSKAIKIKTVGLKDQFSIISQPINNDYEQEQRQKKYEFVYTSYLTLVVDNDYIYTKIVQISPKYVLVNNMRSAICIAQEGAENVTYEVLEVNERREWVWPDTSLEENLMIKKQDTTIEHMFGDNLDQSSIVMIPEEDRFKKWKWSESFPINQLGILTLEIKKTQNRFNNLKARKIIKVIKKQIDATTYIIFEDEDKKYPYYKLENTSSSVSVWFVQKGFKMQEEGCKLGPKTTIPFAFIDYKLDHIIQCYFVKGGRDPIEQGRTLSERDEEIFEYDFEQLDQKHVIDYSDVRYAEVRKLYVSIYTDGCTKIIRFSDNPLSQEQREDREPRKTLSLPLGNQDITKTTFQMNLKEVLISFITSFSTREKGNLIQTRKEVAILTIQEVQIDQYKSPEWFKNKIVIGSIQIDNQCSIKPLFPTILQPRLYKHNDELEMIEIELNMNTENPDIKFIDEIDFKFSGMIVKCDDQFLGYALSFGYGVIELLKTNLTGTHPIFIKAYDQQNEYLVPDFGQVRKISQQNGDVDIFKGVVSIPQKEVVNIKTKTRGLGQSEREENFEQIIEIDEQYKSWMHKTIPQKQQKVYIKSMNLQALDVEVSFLARKGFQLGEKEDTLQLQSTMNWWGLALINIDEAPINIEPFSRNQLFGIQEDIINVISEHYYDGLKKNLFKLIGSTTILGNPRKLQRIIGTGLQDFVMMPYNQRHNGAIAVLGGVASGTGSLFKNTVEGTFGSIQSISGSLSKGLLLLSMDKEYLSEREEQLLTEKPKNVVEGVGFGLQTAINSITSGITGVFWRPITEVRKNGAPGLVKGVYSGAAGLFLKPMSGGLDLISKSTEGIKNTMKIFEAKLFKDRRRLPRPMYGYQQQIKPYNDLDAYIVMMILSSIKEGMLKDDHYLETMKYQEEDRTLFLILTEEHLILLDAHQKAVWWSISAQNISQIDKLQNGLILKLKHQSNGKNHVAIEINHRIHLERIYERLKQLENNI